MDHSTSSSQPAGHLTLSSSTTTAVITKNKIIYNYNPALIPQPQYNLPEKAQQELDKVAEEEKKDRLSDDEYVDIIYTEYDPVYFYTWPPMFLPLSDLDPCDYFLLHAQNFHFTDIMFKYNKNKNLRQKKSVK